MASLQACCHKVSYLGFIPGHIWISLKYCYIFEALVPLFMCINYYTDLKNTISINKYKCDLGEILGNSLCGSMPSEKLGHVKIYFLHHFAWYIVFIALGKYLMP